MIAKQTGKVTRDGRDIHIENLSVKDAITALVKMEEQDQLEVSINAEFQEMFFTEGLLSFMRALKELYGEYYAAAERTFFGDVPPVLVAIETGPEPWQLEQAIWGNFEIPGLQGKFKTSIGTYNGAPIFVLSGTVRQKHKQDVDALIEKTKEMGRTASIYKGKALELRFPDPEEASSPLEFAPKFLKLSYTYPPVFATDTQAIIDNYIVEDIEATEVSVANGLPIKKGILLEGPPGVGKTLLAHTLARICTNHGWTFVYVRDVSKLAEAVNLVRGRWEPCMVFAEDLDRVVGSERTDAVNQVLNVIDGIDGKNSRIQVLVTTNAIDAIHATMLRPGRMDVLISVQAPDAPTVEALIRREAGESLPYTEDLTEVGQLLAGTMPAVIVQVVHRSVRAAQRRTRLACGDESALHPKFTAEDLRIAAVSMKQHIDRLTPQAEDERTPLEKAADTLATALKGNNDVLNNLLGESWAQTAPFTDVVNATKNGKVLAPQPKGIMGKEGE